MQSQFVKKVNTGVDHSEDANAAPQGWLLQASFRRESGP